MVPNFNYYCLKKIINATNFYFDLMSFSVPSSVADPRHFDSDPDPAFNLDPDPDPTFHSDADPGPTFQFYANPYHITHFSQIWTLHCSKDIPPPKVFHLFTLMWIRILLFTLMRIRIQFSTLTSIRFRSQLPKMIRIRKVPS